MSEQVVRNCVLQDRIARGLSDYYSRRTRGVSCPDLLPPDERASAALSYGQRLECARLFVKALNHESAPAAS